jgi:TRAP-type mannitol/chloroaromatic compound transport system permease large subunit
MSFLTPPFGFALFFLKAVAPPGVTMVDLIKGGVPFVGLQAIGTGVIIAFPVLALWLPGLMIS